MSDGKIQSPDPTQTVVPSDTDRLSMTIIKIPKNTTIKTIETWSKSEL